VRIVLICFILAGLSVSGCGDDDAAGGGSDGVDVVATTTQLGDMAKQIGGDRVDVTTILDAKVDPHDYEPRPSDAQAIADADVILQSGGEVDQWLDDLVDQAGGDAERVNVGDRVGADGDDPHWWQDPRLALRAVDEIGRVLGPDATDGAARYRREIAATDRAIAECMERIPADRRKLVTNHDAFGYFARRYDIEVLGSIIPGRSSAAQPSAGDVRELVAAIEREGVRTIFPETALNQRLEKAVARDAGVEVGPPLYADTVGPDGTYLGALRHDARAMAEGFGGRCDL
jgi:ABC-type Zn uptake system ZnuABC Zn-binding protein ZnuA